MSSLTPNQEKYQYNATVVGAIASFILSIISLLLAISVSISDTKIANMDSVLTLLTAQTTRQDSMIIKLEELQSESHNQTKGIRSEILNQETQMTKQDKELSHLIDITGELRTQIGIGNRQIKSLETQLGFSKDLEKIKRRGDLTSLRSTLELMNDKYISFLSTMGGYNLEGLEKISPYDKVAFLKEMYALTSSESKNSYLQFNDTVNAFWIEVPKKLLLIQEDYENNAPEANNTKYVNKMFLDFFHDDLNNLMWYTRMQLHKEIYAKPLIDISKVKLM